MKRFMFLFVLSLSLISLSCEKENESDRLFEKLEVVKVYPANGSTVNTYLFNDVYMIFNYEISYKETLERLTHSIRVYNKTTKEDITKNIFISHSLKQDGHRVNLRQLLMYLPDCEYLVEVYLPRGKYSFNFFTKSSKP